MRPTRVGVMGFGQVGRQVFLSSLDDPHAEVVAVSDVGEPNILHHLLACPTTPRDLAGADTSFTRLTDGRFLKTLAWYDNEWGYSNRVCDLLQLLGTLR